MTVIHVSVELTQLVCGDCGGAYAIAERYRLEKHRSAGFWNCPYCKASWGYGESELDRLNKQLTAMRANLDQKDMAIRTATAEVLAARRLRDRAQKETRRIERRAKAALCPCCNRQFVQLRRHIASKHPGFSHASFEKHKKTAGLVAHD